MRKYLIIGTGLALLAGGGIALAQTPPDAPGGPDGGGPRGPGMEHQGMEHHGRWGMMEHMRHHGPMPGTAFHFRKGDAAIDVMCSDQEPVQACVTAAGTLLDKIGSMQSKPAQ